MFAWWSVRVGLVCSLACYPLALQAQDKSLQQRIADDFIALAGGVHPGYRIAHATGLVVTGTLAPAAAATPLGRPPHAVPAAPAVLAPSPHGGRPARGAGPRPGAAPRGH